MSRFIAILIDGDNENTLGGACSRDLLNISKKIMHDVVIDPNDMFVFLHDLVNDKCATKIILSGIPNVSQNSLYCIQKCFEKVLEISARENVVIFFHYSGHGYQICDINGDETDGFDEIFLGHTMTDDYIWDNLISKLPKNSHIFATMDACHSGSGMDMPYVWRDGKWELNKKTNIKAMCTGYSLSACNDSQCASQDIGETTGFAGSLTAGICDCCNIKTIIYDPIRAYNVLSPRLKRLNQTVELYSL